MDWFHCNNCFLRKGKKFVVSSCGHILCESCASPSHCCVCRTTCKYLPICDQMKPQEQMFFRNPVNLIQTRLEHIAQVFGASYGAAHLSFPVKPLLSKMVPTCILSKILPDSGFHSEMKIASFQKNQKERVLAFYKHKNAEMERKLKEVSEQCYRQVSELKKENHELRKPLSQRRTSPGTFQDNGRIPRMTLPVAVTSPVTPRSRTASNHPGSNDATERLRRSRPIMATPDSATPVSSLSSLHEHGFRTPNSANTPLRSDHITPTLFQFQLLPRPTLQSPQPWNV